MWAGLYSASTVPDCHTRGCRGPWIFYRVCRVGAPGSRRRLGAYQFHPILFLFVKDTRRTVPVGVAPLRPVEVMFYLRRVCSQIEDKVRARGAYVRNWDHWVARGRKRTGRRHRHSPTP